MTAAVFVVAVTGCGDGDVDKPEVVSSSVDFGATDCGTTAVPRVFVINNNTSRSFTYTTALSGGEGSHYTIVPPAGTVLPQSQLQVMVYSKQIPGDSAVTDNLYGETITVTTSKEGDSPHQVEIKQTARGAVFEVSTTDVNFGALQKFGTTAEQPITVTNKGNAPGTLRVDADWPSFSLSQAGTEFEPGQAIDGTIRFTPAHNQPQTLPVTLAATGGAVCGTPAVITATGTGTAQGLAAHPVVASPRPRQRNGGATTLCVRTTTGVVACGGQNTFGMRGLTAEQLYEILPLAGKGGGTGPGNGLDNFDVLNVVQTKGGFLTDVVDLVSGSGLYCARRQDASMWCWGDYRGFGNRAADPALRDNFVATQIAGPGTTLAIAAGYHYRCAVKMNGSAECRTDHAGDNYVSPSSWTVTDATQLAVAGVTGFALKTDGTIMSFGRNSSGERGSSVNEYAAPSAVTDLTGITQIAAGGRGATRSNRFACARKDDGSVWCWGDDRHGQLGDGTQSNRDTPVQVTLASDQTPLANATAITAGLAHACAVVGDGVYCWGRGSEGQIGSGNLSSNVMRAEPVTGLTDVAKIDAAGTRATCAALTTGALRCWGQMAGPFNEAPQPVTAFEP